MRIQEIEGQEREDAFRHLRGLRGAQDLQRVTVVPKPGWPCSGCCGDTELQLRSVRGRGLEAGSREVQGVGEEMTNGIRSRQWVKSRVDKSVG